MGKEAAEVYEEGEVHRGEEPKEDLSDGDLICFECAVGVLVVKINVRRPRGWKWGFASRTSFLFFFFLFVPTGVFAFYAGLDGPVPQCGIYRGLQKWGGETRNEGRQERTDVGHALATHVELGSEIGTLVKQVDELQVAIAAWQRTEQTALINT